MLLLSAFVASRFANETLQSADKWCGGLLCDIIIVSGSVSNNENPKFQ